QALLHDTPYRALYLADVGFDIGPYAVAAQRFEHRYFCFLNSFSAPLADGWLASLYRQLLTPGVGLAGASGSWESAYTNVLAATVLQQMQGPRALHLPRLLAYRALFDPFPNPHIRSNGFMVERATMRAIRTGRIVSKRAAHRFEAGRHSLTKQIAALGLRALIVGRNGEGYEHDAWPHSGTFRQSEQENLLIADNRSEVYQRANEQQRERLARLSWGVAVLAAKGASL
ncbi:MAG: hypothetical protein H7Y32_00915, partial [Chloroflexales bacterium]|nr:hypothetical protein [Chloroflexales bacterium]